MTEHRAIKADPPELPARRRAFPESRRNVFAVLAAEAMATGQEFGDSSEAAANRLLGECVTLGDGRKRFSEALYGRDPGPRNPPPRGDIDDEPFR